MTEPETRKRGSGELELFLGQGHVTTGNEAGQYVITGDVGHRTFPKNSCITTVAWTKGG